MHLKVGELSRRAGITVRTLHHYDDIGLLSPSARSEGGARLYDRADVIRLHRIESLKQLGCSLAEIRGLLDDLAVEPLEIIRRQMHLLDEQAERIQALRLRLERLSEKVARGGETGMDDWLTTLEMMTMYGKHLSEQDLDQLRRADTESPPLTDAWQALVTEIRAAIGRGLTPASNEASALAWRWLRLLREVTGDDPRLALKLKAMQETEPRVQEINGITPAMSAWVAEALANARSALFAKYLSAAELEELRRRQIAHVDDWPALLADVRQAVEVGAVPTDAQGQALAERWQSLFRASHCGEDRAFENKVREAFQHEPDLLIGVGIDTALLSFVHRAIDHLEHDTAEWLADAGPKPSALSVARLRAAHQLFDTPAIFDDPLAVSMLGPAEAAEVQKDRHPFDDPVSRAVRGSLVVRSRVAEEQWAKTAAAGIRQYVILGAGLDTYAYRHADAASACIFEVDHQDTQRWKRDRLRAAGIAEPACLTYVGVDFECDALADALADAGFEPQEPAFFSWLGVVVYLDEDAIERTLRFVASCTKGSGIVFDYVVAPELLSPRERLGLELVAARVAERGEPWKTYFDPEALTETLRSLGFSEVTHFTPQELHQRFFASRSDGLRMGGSSRLILARV